MDDIKVIAERENRLQGRVSRIVDDKKRIAAVAVGIAVAMSKGQSL